VALALKQALAMPLSERRARHEAMLKVIKENSITRWHRSFIARLEGE
jgi:trehalose 6-phosphate synthase